MEKHLEKFENEKQKQERSAAKAHAEEVEQKERLQ